MRSWIYGVSSLLVIGVGLSIFLFGCGEGDDFNEGPFFSKRTEILSFSFQELPNPINANIIKEDLLIKATVPFGTDLTAMVPKITVSPKATIAPPSGVPNDFSDTTNYIVTAEDGTLQTWRVVITESDPDAVSRLVLSSPVWELSPSGQGIPDFFTTDGERGLAYGNGHLYITVNNDKVFILDPGDGSKIGELDMTGTEGGGPKIADVEVSDDGSILACNSVEWTSDGGGQPTTFKVYKWENESSQPTVFLSYTNTQYRMGDSFSVIGDVTGDAVILTTFGRKFLNPTDRGSIVFMWRVNGGIPDAEPTLIEVQGVPTLAKFGSRPHAQLFSIDDEQVYVNANDIQPTLAGMDGSFIARLPNTSGQLYDGFSSYFNLLEFSGKKVLITGFPRSAVESRLIAVDITQGLANVTSEEVKISKNFVAGEVANINASAAVTYNIIDNNNVEVYCLITNQALVKFTLTTVLD